MFQCECERRVAALIDKAFEFRTVACPPDAPHGFPLLVQGDRGQIHLPLTLFARRTRQQLSAGSARACMTVLLPFFSHAEHAPRSTEQGCGWDAAPQLVRRVVANYLNDRYACLVRPHRVGFQLVARTAATRSGVGLFLAALKFFYRVVREEGIYAHENPLVDQVSIALATIEQTAAKDSRLAPRMPARSGVVEPRSHARLSDSYFKLIGEDWVPQIVDDPTLPARVLAGGRLVGWHLREVCVARILFESGGRISEVVGLTLGDWHDRGLKQEASAFSKGSHGRRIKFLRFSANTAKLLRRYFDGERRTHDSGHRRLHDYVSAADQSAAELSKVPIFLSSQRTALRANHFRESPQWMSMSSAAPAPAAPPAPIPSPSNAAVTPVLTAAPDSVSIQPVPDPPPAAAPDVPAIGGSAAPLCTTSSGPRVSPDLPR
jgi:hypothetical protein